MVKIIYYEDPMKEKTETVEVESVCHYLCEKFNDPATLLDLRFFDGEILGTEIDQTGGDFLDINEGIVAITHDSKIARGPETWIYVFVAVVFAAVAIIALKPNIPQFDSGRDQQSGTNRLADARNEPNINGRIDDIFGTVTKHTPPLWQVPYRRGVNNQETEVLLVCAGRGRYRIYSDQWYDGDTPVINIPNASVNIYGPGTHPGSGSPELVIGSVIAEEIGLYRQSNDLNPSELTPPNELETTNIVWSASGSGYTATLVAVSMPEGEFLTDRYSVGDEITLNDCVFTKLDETITLYQGDDKSFTFTFDTFTAPVDLSENKTLKYTVISVTSDTLVLSIPLSVSSPVLTAWSEMTAYQFPSYLVNVISDKPTDVWLKDDRVINAVWYDKAELGETYYQVASSRVKYPYSVGVPYNNFVGPILIPGNATKVIINLVSPNGFYKLVENNETIVSVGIEIVEIELNSSGVETGNTNVTFTNYISNLDTIRASVFKTIEVTLTYANRKIAIRRTTSRDKSENVSNVDIVEWRDLYSFEPVNVTSFGDVTLAHIVIPSNSQSRLVKDRKQNVTLTRLITQYMGNGVFGPAESYATDSFEQILIHTALDPYIGRLSLGNINADGFLALREQITSYFGSDEMCKFGYDFDTTEMTYQDTFTLICDVVMSRPYVQAGVYDAYFEKLQSESSMQVTCRNKITGSETRKIVYDRKYDGVEITYRDNTTGASEVVYLPVDQSARNPERRTLRGCTTKLQAWRYAWRLYNKQIYRTEGVVFDVDEFGRNIIPGSRIDSPDSTRFTKRTGVTDGYRVYDGEVIEVQGLTVELSEPMEFIPGEDHYITFTRQDGANSEAILCTYIDEYRVLLSTLPTEAIYDGYSQDRTKYMLVSEQLKDSVALIPETIEFSLSDENVETNTISLINYTDKYYKDDLTTPI